MGKPASVMNDLMKQDAPHCHAPIHPPAPTPTPAPHPGLPLTILAVPGGTPSMVMIGRTVMPLLFMSMSRKLMPVCGLPSLLVRTRQKIHSPY